MARTKKTISDRCFDDIWSKCAQLQKPIEQRITSKKKELAKVNGRIKRLQKAQELHDSEARQQKLKKEEDLRLGIQEEIQQLQGEIERINSDHQHEADERMILLRAS